MIPGIVTAPLFASTQGVSAVADPASVSKVRPTTTGLPATLTTPSTTVTVSGGTAPYTHSWATTAAASATSPTAATTTFHATVNAGQSLDALFIDTVTDANGVVTTAEEATNFTLIDQS